MTAKVEGRPPVSGQHKQPPKEPQREPVQRSDEERALRARLLKLINSPMKLTRIAELMGAEEFLDTYEVRGQKYYTFNVERFVTSELAKRQAVPARIIEVDEVLLPPGAGELIPGSGEGIERESIPRTTYLLEVFKEMGIDDFTCIRGTVTPEMFRRTEYVLFILNQLRKGVFVCDESNNATYVVHNFDPAQWKEWSEKSKDELREMPFEVVTPVRYFDKDRWKERMKRVIAGQLGRIQRRESPVRRPQATEEEVAQREVAPEGWIWVKPHEFVITIEGNGQTICLGRRRCGDLVAKCGENHPEWVKDFVPRNALQRKLYPHISPEGLEYIQKLADEYPPAPPGWATEVQIGASTKLHANTIQRRSEPYRTSNPEWFKKFTNSTGNVRDYIAPEMQAILHEQVGKFEYAPDGWYTLGRIEVILKRTESVIAPLLSIAEEEFTDECKVYRDPKGHPSMHYSPQVIDWIRFELAKRKPAPQGWLTEYSITQLLGTDREWTQERIREFVTEHPGEEGMYEKPDDRRYLRHYSPQVIEYVRQKDAERRS